MFLFGNLVFNHFRLPSFLNLDCQKMKKEQRVFEVEFNGNVLSLTSTVDTVGRMATFVLESKASKSKKSNSNFLNFFSFVHAANFLGVRHINSEFIRTAFFKGETPGKFTDLLNFRGVIGKEILEKKNDEKYGEGKWRYPLLYTASFGFLESEPCLPNLLKNKLLPDCAKMTKKKVTFRWDLGDYGDYFRKAINIADRERSSREISAIRTLEKSPEIETESVDLKNKIEKTLKLEYMDTFDAVDYTEILKNRFSKINFFDNYGSYTSRTVDIIRENMALPAVVTACGRFDHQFHRMHKDERAMCCFLDGERLLEKFDIPNSSAYSLLILLSRMMSMGECSVPQPEFENFKKFVFSGKTYEKMMEWSSRFHTMTREEMKSNFQFFLCSLNDNQKNQKWKCVTGKYLNRFFPNIFKTIRRFKSIKNAKNEDVNELCGQLQKIETEIISRMLFKLELNGIEGVSVHDAIYLKESDADALTVYDLNQVFHSALKDTANICGTLIDDFEFKSKTKPLKIEVKPTTLLLHGRNITEEDEFDKAIAESDSFHNTTEKLKSGKKRSANYTAFTDEGKRVGKMMEGLTFNFFFRKMKKIEPKIKFGYTESIDSAINEVLEMEYFMFPTTSVKHLKTKPMILKRKTPKKRKAGQSDELF